MERRGIDSNGPGMVGVWGGGLRRRQRCGEAGHRFKRPRDGPHLGRGSQKGIQTVCREGVGRRFKWPGDGQCMGRGSLKGTQTVFQSPVMPPACPPFLCKSRRAQAQGHMASSLWVDSAASLGSSVAEGGPSCLAAPGEPGSPRWYLGRSGQAGVGRGEVEAQLTHLGRCSEVLGSGNLVLHAHLPPAPLPCSLTASRAHCSSQPVLSA